MAVCYLNNLLLDRDNADSSSDSSYKIIYRPFSVKTGPNDIT